MFHGDLHLERCGEGGYPYGTKIPRYEHSLEKCDISLIYRTEKVWPALVKPEFINRNNVVESADSEILASYSV